MNEERHIVVAYYTNHCVKTVHALHACQRAWLAIHVAYNCMPVKATHVQSLQIAHQYWNGYVAVVTHGRRPRSMCLVTKVGVHTVLTKAFVTVTIVWNAFPRASRAMSGGEPYSPQTTTKTLATSSCSRTNYFCGIVRSVHTTGERLQMAF